MRIFLYTLVIIRVQVVVIVRESIRRKTLPFHAMSSLFIQMKVDMFSSSEWFIKYHLIDCCSVNSFLIKVLIASQCSIFADTCLCHSCCVDEILCGCCFQCVLVASVRDLLSFIQKGSIYLVDAQINEAVI